MANQWSLAAVGVIGIAISFMVIAAVPDRAQADTDDPVVMFLEELGGNAPRGNLMFREVSSAFDVRVSIQYCGNGRCMGKATIDFILKGDSSPLQTIEVERLYLQPGDSLATDADVVELPGDNGGNLIVDDFNFDGYADFAFRNGNDGNYEGPSWDVWLFSKASRGFVANPTLTRLASENLGFFQVDDEAKQLVTYTKSGCCLHWTKRYRVNGDEPVNVRVTTEQTTPKDEVIVTTKDLVDGEWRTVVETRKPDGRF